MSARDILISLDPRFADAILCGEKSVELRRRRPGVPPGTRVWMYSKLPIGSVVGCAVIDQLHDSSPTAIWKRFGAKAGINRSEYFDYFRGASSATALVLTQVRRLRAPISLDGLRQIRHDFHPPQFFSDLRKASEILDAVVRAV